MRGKLENNHIIIKENRQARRLYNKSNIGTPLSDEGLEVSLIEGLFLVKEKKLSVYKKEKKIEYDTLLQIAVKKNKRCQLLYLVYNDLRERGYVFEELRKKPLFDFKGHHTREAEGKTIEKTCYVAVFSEREAYRLEKLNKLSKWASRNEETIVWISVVDDEGDITYYEIKPAGLKGKISAASFPVASGMLTDDRIIIPDKKTGTKLFKKEFLGKPFNDGLQLSFVEAAYLMEKNQLILTEKNDGDQKITLQRFKAKARRIQPNFDMLLQVYTELKERGMIIKTGFKYGSHFRAYAKDPHEHHAEYLIDIIPTKEKSVGHWSTISRAVRLAHSVNKTMVFALLDEKQCIKYMNINRVRP